MILGISASLDSLDTLGINRRVEEVLPSLARSEVRVLYIQQLVKSNMSETQLCVVENLRCAYTSMDAAESIRSICGVIVRQARRLRQ